MFNKTAFQAIFNIANNHIKVLCAADGNKKVCIPG